MGQFWTFEADVHHCSKFFQSDARATETLKIESSDQPGWSLSIYNLFERLSWQMALFSLWWTTPSTDPLLTNCNIPPSFYQLYMFRASKSVLLALPRLKVLLMYSLWREIQGISTKFWHYFPKFDFVLLKRPFATLKKSRPVVHACVCVRFSFRNPIRYESLWDTTCIPNSWKNSILTPQS